MSSPPSSATLETGLELAATLRADSPSPSQRSRLGQALRGSASVTAVALILLEPTQPCQSSVVASYVVTEPAQVVRIRDAASGDGDALAELHARSRAVYYRAGGHEVAAVPDERYRETWRKMVADARLAILVAVLGDDIVGVITLDANGVFPTNASNEKRVRLVGIFVDPGNWSSGVGSALMARFISIARQADAVGEVDVWQRNSRAIRFYERHGWTRDGTSRPGPAGADYIGFIHLP